MRVRSGRRRLWWFRAWLSKNPLLRPPTGAQRLSTIGAALLCLVLALSIPVVGLLTWSAASARVAHPKEIHTVQATVTAPRDTGVNVPRAPTRVPPEQTIQWQWHGERHSDTLPATAAPTDGNVTTVRVDEHGDLLSAQFGTTNAVTLTVLAAVAATAIALALAFTALRLRSRWLLRLRTQDWEREWLLVQPLWTGRGYRA